MSWLLSPLDAVLTPQPGHPFSAWQKQLSSALSLRFCLDTPSSRKPFQVKYSSLGLPWLPGLSHLCLDHTVLPKPVVSVVSPAHLAAQHPLTQFAEIPSPLGFQVPADWAFLLVEAVPSFKLFLISLPPDAGTSQDWAPSPPLSPPASPLVLASRHRT